MSVIAAEYKRKHKNDGNDSPNVCTAIIIVGMKSSPDRPLQQFAEVIFLDVYQYVGEYLSNLSVVSHRDRNVLPSQKSASDSKPFGARGKQLRRW